MNYGEELAYWYLRLNGFFSLTDFVLHKSEAIEHSSDCDILAIRTPHVEEAIGGMTIDWDEELRTKLESDRTVGLICEVKTGDKLRKVLRKGNVDSAIDRLGFAEDLSEAKEILQTEKKYLLGDEYQIAKLLIADMQLDDTHRPYFCLSLGHIREFIKERFNRYQEKFRDRIYFNSNLMQYLIWEAELKRRNNGNV